MKIHSYISVRLNSTIFIHSRGLFNHTCICMRGLYKLPHYCMFDVRCPVLFLQKCCMLHSHKCISVLKGFPMYTVGSHSAHLMLKIDTFRNYLLYFHRSILWLKCDASFYCRQDHMYRYMYMYLQVLSILLIHAFICKICLFSQKCSEIL